MDKVRCTQSDNFLMRICLNAKTIRQEPRAKIMGKDLGILSFKNTCLYARNYMI